MTEGDGKQCNSILEMKKILQRKDWAKRTDLTQFHDIHHRLELDHVDKEYITDDNSRNYNHISGQRRPAPFELFAV